jgi:hypothetical protein
MIPVLSSRNRKIKGYPDEKGADQTQNNDEEKTV